MRVLSEQDWAPGLRDALAALPPGAACGEPTVCILYVSCDGTGTPMVREELEGVKGKRVICIGDGTAWVWENRRLKRLDHRLGRGRGGQQDRGGSASEAIRHVPEPERSRRHAQPSLPGSGLPLWPRLESAPPTSGAATSQGQKMESRAGRPTRLTFSSRTQVGMALFHGLAQALTTPSRPRLRGHFLTFSLSAADGIDWGQPDEGT